MEQLRLLKSGCTEESRNGGGAGYMVPTFIKELPAVRRTQPITKKAYMSLTTHVQLLQWLHGKQQQHKTVIQDLLRACELKLVVLLPLTGIFLH